MYLYFNKEGVLKEIVNDKPLRQGSVNVDFIYAYFETETEDGSIPTSQQLPPRNLWISYLLPSGERIPSWTAAAEIQYPDDGEIVDEEIPPNPKRDLKYFKYYQPYPFYVIPLTFTQESDSELETPSEAESALSENGVVSCTIRLNDENTTLYTYGMIVFNVENAVRGISDGNIGPDKFTTVAQFQYLLAKLGNYYTYEQLQDLISQLQGQVNNKLDKLETSGQYVYTHLGIKQGELPVSTLDTGGTIAKRENDGRLKVATPTTNGDATTKEYVDNNLLLKADKATTYTKTEVDNAIASAVSSAYKYKGSVATYNDLPASGNEVGDVYNVEDTGDNYAWTGTAWDKLSGTVDLSGYYTKTQTNALLDTKADKVTTYTKDQTDALLQNYAHANGTYPNMTVGKSLTTKQIENVSDEVGSTQTNPFTFQATGTDNNTTSTPTAPIAKHLELRGHSVVWRQLYRTVNVDNPVTTDYGITYQRNSTTGICTFSGTSTSASDENITLIGSVVSSPTLQSHKYYVRWNLTGTKPTNSNATSQLLGGVLSIGTDGIVNGSNSNTTYAQIKVKAGATINFSIRPQIIDLTDLYGAGNEPISVLQFVRDYPLPYYSYNAGQLKSCNSSKLITVGCNQLSALNTFIRVIAGQTYELSGVSLGGYIEEYDGQQNLIKTSSEITSTTQITLTNNTHYVKVQATTYSNAMFRLYWGESHDYVPYEKHEYDLPSVELRSVGGVYDTITTNGVYTQRIGTRAYESGDESDTSVITDLTSTYYVLETPVVSQVSSFAENIIVDDFGTMEFVPSADNVEPIIPQGNKLFYPADYVLFIDELYNRSKDGGGTSSASSFATQEELQLKADKITMSDIKSTQLILTGASNEDWSTSGTYTNVKRFNLAGSFYRYADSEHYRGIGTATCEGITINWIQLSSFGDINEYAMCFVGASASTIPVSQLILLIPNSANISTVEELRTWLGTHNITVEYAVGGNYELIGSLVNGVASEQWKPHQDSKQWFGTQTQYDNLGTYDSNTIYNILES